MASKSIAAAFFFARLGIFARGGEDCAAAPEAGCPAGANVMLQIQSQHAERVQSHLAAKAQPSSKAPQLRSKSSAGMSMSSKTLPITQEPWATGVMSVWDKPEALADLTLSKCGYLATELGGLNSPYNSSRYYSKNRVCAVDKNLWDNGIGPQQCGRCYEVIAKTPNTAAINPDVQPVPPIVRQVVQVVDRNEHWEDRHFDCRTHVFQELTGHQTDLFTIDYKPVNCDVESGGRELLVYNVLTDTASNKLGTVNVLFFNYVTSVASVTMTAYSRCGDPPNPITCHDKLTIPLRRKGHHTNGGGATWENPLLCDFGQCGGVVKPIEFEVQLLNGQKKVYKGADIIQQHGYDPFVDVWSRHETIGCFGDNIPRDLSVDIGFATIDECAEKCGNYGFFGRQWTGYCFCGNSFGSYGEATGCDCSPDASDIGAWKNCVYAHKPEPFELVGCYADWNNPHDLPVWQGTLSIQACAEKCTMAGKKYFGRQGLRYCMCGDSFGAYGENSGCNTDPETTFIGWWTQMVYALKPVKFNLLGCYADAWDRDLPNQKNSGSVQACAEQCKDYKYFGRQWERACFCGDAYGKYGETTGCDCDPDAANSGSWANCVYEKIS